MTIPITDMNQMFRVYKKKKEKKKHYAEWNTGIETDNSSASKQSNMYSI